MRLSTIGGLNSTTTSATEAASLPGAADRSSVCRPRTSHPAGGAEHTPNVIGRRQGERSGLAAARDMGRSQYRHRRHTGSVIHGLSVWRAPAAEPEPGAGRPERSEVGEGRNGVREEHDPEAGEHDVEVIEVAQLEDVADLETQFGSACWWLGPHRSSVRSGRSRGRRGRLERRARPGCAGTAPDVENRRPGDRAERVHCGRAERSGLTIVDPGVTDPRPADQVVPDRLLRSGEPFVADRHRAAPPRSLLATSNGFVVRVVKCRGLSRGGGRTPRPAPTAGGRDPSNDPRIGTATVRTPGLRGDDHGRHRRRSGRLAQDGVPRVRDQVPLVARGMGRRTER